MYTVCDSWQDSNENNNEENYLSQLEPGRAIVTTDPSADYNIRPISDDSNTNEKAFDCTYAQLSHLRLEVSCSDTSKHDCGYVTVNCEITSK